MITVIDKFGNIGKLSINKNWKIEIKELETEQIITYDSLREMNKSYLKWKELKCQHIK